MSFLKYLKVFIYGMIGLGACVCATIAHSIASLAAIVAIAVTSVVIYGKKVDKHTDR